MKRYTVAVDFDGVLHSYTSPWVNARTIPDPPVHGAMEWLVTMSKTFDIAITSTRNFQFLGIWAMRRWIRRNLADYFWPIANSDGYSFDHMGVDQAALGMADEVMEHVSFPRKKAPALIYLDDRAIRFEGPGTWPTRGDVYKSRPWNKPKVQE
jgi:hypothetical protein